MKNKLIRRVGAVCTSAVMTLGSIAVAGIASPALTASAADANYARLLQYSMYFYDANMCGDEVQSKGGMSWRGNCHTDDDVPGGFHDAGDHAMFGLPQGYTATALGLSYYEFKDAYQATGQEDHIKMILNHFCTFFRNSTKLNGDSVSNFLYQKGSGQEDHAYWGRPEEQGGKRKMYWTNSGASDIAANYAAALALNYKNFGNEQDLKYAKALYKFSTQFNQCATDGPDTFYASSKCADEQAMAAGCLALATGDSEYKNAVKNVNSLGVWWAYGWNDANLGAAVMNGIVNGDWSKANSYLSGQCSGSNYLFMDKWGSARLNCSMQFMALVATKEQQGNYTDWAKGQMNIILGNNKTQTCYVTGFASNSAKNAHHRAASGYSGYVFNTSGKEWNDQRDHNDPFAAYDPANGKTLIGALVGGPCNEGGDYHDNMLDYVCNEVAIDYNAGLVGAAAGLYHFAKSGSTDSNIEGVTKIYSGSSQPGTTGTTSGTTTGTTQTTSGTTRSTTNTTATTGGTGDDIVLMPKDMTVDTEKGDDGEINNYAEFSPKGAKSCTLYLTVKSNDTEVSGAFGTWTGEWEQEDFKGVKVGSDKTVAIDYTFPSKVGQTIKAMVFWPHGNNVVIDKVVLHTGSGSTTQSTGSTSRTTSNSTTRTTTNTTATTGGSGNDVVLMPKDMTVDTEKGDDGETNNYAEFSPKGAKSCTLYLTVKSNDTEVSGAFGTWTGEWEQEDFKGVKVGSDKTVAIDYTFPSKVGQTIKAMVFWPHGNDVVIDKVVLHMDGSSTTKSTTSTTKTTSSTTKTTASTTKTTQSTTSTTTTSKQQGTKRGDANGDGIVGLSDAVLIARIASNDKTVRITETGRKNADVTGDGTIDDQDLRMILKYLANVLSDEEFFK